MESLYEIVRSGWTIWLMVLFFGVVAWAFWPRRKDSLEDHKNIPLRDDPVRDDPAPDKQADRGDRPSTSGKE